jgi:uncharacterized protein (DUF1800 family)
MASLVPNTSVLGNVNSKHLLRRATFRFTKTLIDQFSVLTPQQALDLLVLNNPLSVALPNDPITNGGADGFWTESTALPGSFNAQQRKAVFVSGWWWYNAINDPTLKYKLTHFLSTRFTVEKTNNAGSSTDFYDYLRLLMFYSYGNYKTLAKKMTVCNSMLLYLDNDSNNVNSPNENYAREFFELFTIGKGEQIASGNYTNYTENDIVEAAKVLTGFRRIANRTIIDATTGIPKGGNLFSQHNTQTKTFSAAFSNTAIPPATNAAGMDNELDNFVEMIFSKLATAKNISRKMYIYFVKGKITPEIETDIITPLAQDLLNNGYQIVPVLRRLLESQHFYDLDDTNAVDETIGAIIKSPVQQVSEICTYLQATIPNPTTNAAFFYNTFYKNFIHDTYLVGSNMALFSPSNVAGHLAYYQEPAFDKSWISSATLIARYRLAESLLDGVNRIGGNNNIAGKINISDVIKNGGLITDASNAFALTSELCNALFAQQPDEDRINYFMNSFLLQDYPAYYWGSTWFNFINSNNNSVVEPRLKLLLSKILSAPESQIF